MKLDVPVGTLLAAVLCALAMGAAPIRSQPAAAEAADSGTELWNRANGTGHQGGIISYAVNGKQYIALTAGFGGMLSDDYAATFGGVYKSMPRDDGALIVYSLK